MIDKWNMDIPIVTKDFLEKSEDALAKVDCTPYRLDSMSKKRKIDEITNTTTTTSTSATKISNESQHISKKIKLDITESSTTKSTSVITTPEGNDNLYLQSSSVFSGKCETNGTALPLIITIVERKGNELTGTANWPTLNALNPVEGKASGSSFELVEIDKDSKEPVSTYSGRVSESGHFSGKFAVPSKNIQGSFDLPNTFFVPVVKNDFFTTSSKWKGICYTPTPFVLEIESRNGNQWGGVMTWPTIDDSKTKVKGSLCDGKVIFEEYEVASGDDIEMETPNHFEASVKEGEEGKAVDGVLVVGKGTDDVLEGTFAMKLV
eukprot:TRINITY_DN5882_c0_g1_i1.p1 TRINITY_DN5882_c0_g1~~TRINITY_DN5882_c0_g1_i1.p1  ORF type:complete len:321 (-),score=66.03 TRINITY_DN5882_c0_g1_i1:64-1026(-)